MEMIVAVSCDNGDSETNLLQFYNLDLQIDSRKASFH